MTGPASPAGGDRLSALLPGTAVRVGTPARDWREAVRAAGEALVASGAAEPAYSDEMIATIEELGPYVVIAPGVALAHSRPSPAVRRSGLSLVRLAQGVAFGHAQNDPVWLVIGLAAPDDTSHVMALATMAELLADDGRRAALIEASDAAAVTALIEGYERETSAAAPR
jgi:PTS system ascorbate-specific IIA component